MFNKEEVLEDWEIKLVYEASFGDGEISGIRKVAKALKDNNADLKLIMITTGLSEAEIEKL
jgi:hypothetical protein